VPHKADATKADLTILGGPTSRSQGTCRSVKSSELQGLLVNSARQGNAMTTIRALMSSASHGLLRGLAVVALVEAWITLKTNGCGNIRPDELARRICHLAMEGERDPVRLHDRALLGLIPATIWREVS
jgi:hypothetical protein